jgi:hypothetical protein
MSYANLKQIPSPNLSPASGPRRFQSEGLALTTVYGRIRCFVVSQTNHNFSDRVRALKRRLRLYSLTLIPFCSVLMVSTHCIAGALIYSTAFETSEGYNANLDLAGQKGWQYEGSGGNGLLSGIFPGRGQQAFIGYAPPATGGDYLFLYQPINRAFAQVQFSVTMSIVDSTTTNWDDFGWSVYNQQGKQLFTLDFDNYDLGIYYYLDDTNSRVWSGLEFTNSIPYSLSIDLDFAHNRWSAKFNGALLATNQPITTIGSALNLGDVDAGWIVYDPTAPGDNFMVFDDYLVTASLPAPQLKLLGIFGGQTALRLYGTPDMAFAIEASTNVTQWTPLKTNVTTGGSFDYLDEGAAGLAHRFYRARWVP